MARIRRARFRAAPRRRALTWLKPATAVDSFASSTGFIQTTLLTPTQLLDNIVDREATIVRSHGSAVAAIQTSGDMSTNAVWQICFGVIVSHEPVVDVPEPNDVNSSGEFFVFCCLLLSKGGQGTQIECRIDSKAMRKIDTRTDTVTSIIQHDLIQGTNTTGTVGAALDLRLGVLLS